MSKNVQPFKRGGSSGLLPSVSGHNVLPKSGILQSSSAGKRSQESPTETNNPSRVSPSTTRSKHKMCENDRKKPIFDEVDQASSCEGHNLFLTKGSPYAARKFVVVPIPPPSLIRKELALQKKNITSKAPAEISTEKSEKIEEESRYFNPDFSTSKGLIKDIVSVLSERDGKDSYKISNKNIVKETTKLDLALTMTKDEVEHLVNTEREELSNMLKNVSPELVNQTSAIFPLKKRLYNLRLSQGNTRILRESVMASPINSSSPLPELIATMMDTYEKADKVTIPSHSLFNSLFPTGRKESPVMILSPATLGPMEDVMIPTVEDEDFQEAMLSTEMVQVSPLVHLTDRKPPLDGFTKVKPAQPRRRGRRRRPYHPLSDEDPPWDNEALLVSIEAVGACPTFSLRTTNVSELVPVETLLNETYKGIEYILDCQPHQYCSKVQLRGSHPPPWFPGYMVALSNMQGSVSLAKSPSQVLLSAWKSVEPEVFSDDSVVYN